MKKVFHFDRPSVSVYNSKVLTCGMGVGTEAKAAVKKQIVLLSRTLIYSFVPNIREKSQI